MIAFTSSDKRHLTGNVADLRNALVLMQFVCHRQQSHHYLVIRSVVPSSNDDAVCQIPEPTIRISGRNGLCLDVKGGRYHDGNPIQLYPCKFNSEVNQL